MNAQVTPATLPADLRESHYSPCLIPNCDGYGHPGLCTRFLDKTVIGGDLELSTELVVDGDGGRHISVFGIRDMDEALLVRATTRKQLLTLAGEFADVAKLIERAVDELPEDTTGRCYECERDWPVADLAVDGNGDQVCCDCRATGASVLDGDQAAYRAYVGR
ncbi:hypothetical protein [Streptacidiphilus anmyonensis]|uniref:hypothetical protein n=1 Tax=Streptacidiphilus anmyonensis TaxID=405782 RepID=UPI0005A7E0A8|nr:hypothetical protein [Streptacidiphilus anmyonensis]